MVQKRIAVLFLTFVLMGLASGKVYDKCTLAKELDYAHHAPKDQIPYWVCIAEYKYSYNTSSLSEAHPDGSRDYGIFQINNQRWCWPKGSDNGCELPCDRLLNDDISDDVACALEIYEKTWKSSGDGFTAFAAYNEKCNDPITKDFVKECF